MAGKRFSKGSAVLLGGIVAASPLIAACGSGSSYENWAATDGAAGLINLDDVQAAFKDSKSATDFEDRVNKIYEGDGLVLIRASQNGENLTLEGWEDLDGDSEIDDASDDQLFSIVQDTNKEYDMRGYHGNGYYRSHYGAGDFLFTYMVISSLSPRGYYYSTPISRGSSIRNQRSRYRQSSAYNRQAQRNSNFNRKQSSFSGSRYQQSRSNVSSNRQTYQQTQKSSGSFKNSNAVSRPRAGSSFRSSSRSGARGAGGGMRVRTSHRN
ncbi:MAG: hypothetical protein CL895_08525 [Dehalococcoidia bacterium]|nr:hypothetical protein [Dehalococcoidia bacterium]|tara:strand:+ start:62 stop:862 length:801 start_codon:yes stop_codon:yes gene_type:complete